MNDSAESLEHTEVPICVASGVLVAHNRMMPKLRDLLAERAQTTRAEGAMLSAATGAFSTFDERKLIHFSTVGRISGDEREKWWFPFAADGDVLYLLEESGTAANWVRNVMADPAVVVEGVRVTARIVNDRDEETRARRLCERRFARVGLVVADLLETGLVIAFDAVDPTHP